MQNRRLIFPIYQEIHRREPGEKAHKQFMGERDSVKQEKWAGDGKSGAGSTRPWSHTYGGKIHRFSLPSGNLTSPSSGNAPPLAPGQARPREPRLGPERRCGSTFTRKTRDARPRPSAPVRARQQGSRCLWSLCAHHDPRGRAPCTRKDPKMQRESVQRERQHEESRASHRCSRGRASPSTRVPAFACTFPGPCPLTSGQAGVTLYRWSHRRFPLWLERHKVGGDEFGTSSDLEQW